MPNMNIKPVSSQVDFPSLEEGILNFWDKNDIFQKSIKNRHGEKRFVFYEGPPTANGKPHMGHVLQRSLKDLILRYKTMKGFLVERRAGWDTHGLPVEIEVEKELGLRGKQDILSLKDTHYDSIKFFNEKCKKSVFRYTDDWINLTKRIGFWIDFEHAYVTYHNDYIESVWNFLEQVSDKGLLYKDYKVVPYCPRCGTSLSSHELSQGYKDDVEDLSVYPLFKVEEPGKEYIFDKAEPTSKTTLSNLKSLDIYLVAWTTTPWTLPGNVGLAVKPEEKYGLFLDKENKIILIGSTTLASSWLKREHEQVAIILGEDLVNIKYQPLFPYLQKLINKNDAFFVMPADFVSLEDGTGIVHTAVMYGIEDFELGKKFNLPMKHLVSPRGEFINEVEEFAGQFVKNADPKIIESLEKRGLLYNKGTIKHTYPFCWRCSTPLLYYALDSWFIKTTAVKDKLLKDNQEINWIPQTIKNGRMGNWLEGLIDWNISRNRFWGTPLPIWVCFNGHIKVIGSRKEIEDLGGRIPDNLHKPYIDEVVFKCPDCKEEMKRIPDVADVWMDSGAMPFAQWHYPFENQEKYKEWYPADYIVEGIDQTRGWFFTLMAEAMLVQDLIPAPYKNVVATGLVLDDQGQKMSKSKGNVVSPWDVIPLTGADTMRWYMFTAAPAGGDYLFSKEIIAEKLRRFTLIFWNSYKFFTDYATLSNWSLKEFKNTEADLTVLDKWILARLAEVIFLVNSKLDEYDFTTSSRAIEDFVVNDLSTWYIRRSRNRVGPAAEKQDEQIFLSTLYEVLVTLSKLLAPFLPFISEEIYKNLTAEESVHLVDYPLGHRSQFNAQLLKDMKLIRELVEIGHAQRKEAAVKLRQPLAKFIYYSPEKLPTELEQLLADELNVKHIEFKKFSNKELRGELNTNITPQLLKEGEVRELTRQVQQLRKEAGLTLNDRVKIISPQVPEGNLKKILLKQTNAVSVEKGDKLAIEVVK